MSPDSLLKVLNEHIFLPQIQRGYEWQEERIERFFDSLIKGIPLGLVLLYQHDDSFTLFGRKFFDNFDAKSIEDQYKYDIRIKDSNLIVLDGQQRLQTLKLGLKGKYYGKVLYHNVLWMQRPSMQESTFKLSTETDPPYFAEHGELYVSLPVLYKILSQLAKTAGYTRDEKLESFKRISREEGLGSLEQSHLLNVFNYSFDHLRTVLFQTEHLARILKLQIVHPNEVRGGKNKLANLLEIFIRFNQGGLRLEKSDLMFSVLKAQGWIEAELEFNRLAEETQISKDLLMKAQMIVSGLDARDDIYTAADHIDELKASFDDFKQTIKRIYDRVQALTDLPERIFSRFNFLIPIVYFFSKQKSALDNEVIPPAEILRYMLVIYFNSNLRSDTYLQEIIEIVKKSLQQGKPNFPLEEIFAYISKLGVKTTIDEESLNRDPILTYSLIQRKNWRPIYTGNRLHIDHIFPRSRSDEYPDNSEKYVESIWNKYVIFQGDNIRKQDALPEDYFSGNNTHLKGDYILPDDPSLLKKENMLKCLEWRREQIVRILKNELGVDLSPIRSIEEEQKPEDEEAHDELQAWLDYILSSGLFVSKKVRKSVYEINGKYVSLKFSKHGRWFNISKGSLETADVFVWLCGSSHHFYAIPKVRMVELIDMTTRNAWDGRPEFNIDPQKHKYFPGSGVQIDISQYYNNTDYLK